MQGQAVLISARRSLGRLLGIFNVKWGSLGRVEAQSLGIGKKEVQYVEECERVEIFKGSQWEQIAGIGSERLTLDSQ